MKPYRAIHRLATIAAVLCVPVAGVRPNSGDHRNDGAAAREIDHQS
jgi:hypothetical protein